MIIIELDQTGLLPFSILLGLFTGFIYGIIKIIRCLFYHNNVIFFIEDVAFVIFVSLSFCILHYNCTYGVVRFYSFIGCSCGFLIYNMTLGKLSAYIALRIKKFTMPYILMIKGLFLKFCSYCSHLIRSETMIYRAKKGF